MRTCTKCHEPKPLTEYYRHKETRDGRFPHCKECHKAGSRARRLALTGDALVRVREKTRDYYRNNRELIAEKNRAYHAKNPHINWETRYRRRARQYGFEPVVESFTRDDLIDRYGDACVHCGGLFEQLDHYPVPVALGGPHTLENCVPACADCNVAQSAEIQAARKATRAAA